MDCIETDRITPDVPEGLKVAYRSSSGILIEWRNTNVCTVDHYEVQWELNKHTVNTEVTKNCFAVEEFLKSNKSYLIKVRAINRRSQKSEFTEIRAKTKSDHSTLTVFVPFVFIVAVQYKPVIAFFALLIAMIATFFNISTKHARFMYYLLALVMTGNVIIAVILYLRYPVGFVNYVCATLGYYTLMFYSYREGILLEHYMLEKNMISTKLEEKKIMQKLLLLLHVILPTYYTVLVCFDLMFKYL